MRIFCSPFKLTSGKVTCPNRIGKPPHDWLTDWLTDWIDCIASGWRTYNVRINVSRPSCISVATEKKSCPLTCFLVKKKSLFGWRALDVVSSYLYIAWSRTEQNCICEYPIWWTDRTAICLCGYWSSSESKWAEPNFSANNCMVRVKRHNWTC